MAKLNDFYPEPLPVGLTTIIAASGDGDYTNINDAWTEGHRHLYFTEAGTYTLTATIASLASEDAASGFSFIAASDVKRDITIDVGAFKVDLVDDNILTLYDNIRTISWAKESNTIIADNFDFIALGVTAGMYISPWYQDIGYSGRDAEIYKILEVINSTSIRIDSFNAEESLVSGANFDVHRLWEKCRFIGVNLQSTTNSQFFENRPNNWSAPNTGASSTTQTSFDGVVFKDGSAFRDDPENNYLWYDGGGRAFLYDNFQDYGSWSVVPFESTVINNSFMYGGYAYGDAYIAGCKLLGFRLYERSKIIGNRLLDATNINRTIGQEEYDEVDNKHMAMFGNTSGSNYDSEIASNTGKYQGEMPVNRVDGVLRVGGVHPLNVVYTTDPTDKRTYPCSTIVCDTGSGVMSFNFPVNASSDNDYYIGQTLSVIDRSNTFSTNAVTITASGSKYNGTNGGNVVLNTINKGVYEFRYTGLDYGWVQTL